MAREPYADRKRRGRELVTIEFPVRLLAAVDAEAARLELSRSAFVRSVLRQRLARRADSDKGTVRG